LADQIFILLGTVIGAVLGMTVPVISSTLTRRDRNSDVQRQTALEIMALFEHGGPPEEGFASYKSATRRRLYLLALRLDDQRARNACMNFIASAGGDQPIEEEVLNSWDVMMNEVGHVYRRSRRSTIR
jgi:hypothetical protein